jgi:hypothetical protein
MRKNSLLLRLAAYSGLLKALQCLLIKEKHSSTCTYQKPYRDAFRLYDNLIPTKVFFLTILHFLLMHLMT